MKKRIILEIAKNPKTKRLGFKPQFLDNDPLTGGKSMRLYVTDETFFTDTPRFAGECCEASIVETRISQKKTSDGRRHIIVCTVKPKTGPNGAFVGSLWYRWSIFTDKYGGNTIFLKSPSNVELFPCSSDIVVAIRDRRGNVKVIDDVYFFECPLAFVN